MATMQHPDHRIRPPAELLGEFATGLLYAATYEPVADVAQLRGVAAYAGRVSQTLTFATVDADRLRIDADVQLGRMLFAQLNPTAEEHRPPLEAMALRCCRLVVWAAIDALGGDAGSIDAAAISLSTLLEEVAAEADRAQADEPGPRTVPAGAADVDLAQAVGR